MKPAVILGGLALQMLAANAFAQHLGTPADPYLLAYVGSAINVIVASAIGVVGGFAHKGEPDRMKLFTLVPVYALMAAACVTLVPLWWDWVIEPYAQPPLALIFGFAARFLIPVLTDHGPALFKGLLTAWATRAQDASPPRRGDEP